MDKVTGLKLGAEDYIVKPFEAIELLARIEVVLRRYTTEEENLCFKDIVIEDLNFKQAKAETEKAKSDKGKDYNKMIHLFDYSRYKSTFEGCCYLRNVNLIKVNPAYTSKIAGQKYCGQRKMVIHQGASFVIARKGQGFVDKYIKPKKKKSAYLDNKKSN